VNGFEESTSAKNRELEGGQGHVLNASMFWMLPFGRWSVLRNRFHQNLLTTFPKGPAHRRPFFGAVRLQAGEGRQERPPGEGRIINRVQKKLLAAETLLSGKRELPWPFHGAPCNGNLAQRSMSVLCIAAAWSKRRRDSSCRAAAVLTDGSLPTPP